MERMERIKHFVTENPDLVFAILLAVGVFTFFAITEPLFFTHRTGFAIMNDSRFWALSDWH